MAHRQLLMFLIYCMSNSYANVPSTNIALGKPAKSSSKWMASYSTNPSNVVDGNWENNINYGSCTATNDSDTAPWWLVDLGDPYHIHNITIVNRGDWKEEYLQDFYIEMFRVHPLIWPNSSSAIPCLFYDVTDILYDAETFTCDAPVVGRYVRIRKHPMTGSVLNLFLCEVEIRGTPAGKQGTVGYQFYFHNKKLLSSSSLQTVPSRSLLECVIICRRSIGCYDLNFNNQTLHCQLISLRSDSDVIEQALGWTFVSLS